MTNKKGNRLTVRTRKALISSYIELLMDSPNRTIKINEICKNAGLSRTTFYKHFQTKEEILEAYLDEVLGKMFYEFQQHTMSKGDYTNKFISAATLFFEVWKSKADLYKLIKTVKAENTLIERFKDHHRFVYQNSIVPVHPIGNNVIEEFFISEVAYRFFSLLDHWMMTGMKQTPEEVAELLSMFRVPGLIEALAEKYGTQKT